MRILGVIPARGGSKTIPRKNLSLLAGKPLLAYALEAALKSKLLDRVIVSTEDEEIARVARSYGAEAPFVRPKELARDEVSIIPVVQHAMKCLGESEGWIADIIASIQPTSPLVETTDIDSAIDKLIKTGCDSVVSVCRIVHGHPYWAIRLEGDRAIALDKRGYEHLQKQDLPVFYMPNGALYVRKREVLEKWDGRGFALGRDVRAIVMDEAKSIDIDTLLNLIVAENLIKAKKMS